MRTSAEWWEATKADPKRFTDWLQDQYHGEITAVSRIGKFRGTFTETGSDEDTILRIIQGQEYTHALWIKDLLVSRGIAPRVLMKTERYWDQTVGGIDSLETGAGVAAHAELMRLERIRTIVEDTEAPKDVREVFERILPQEEFHAKAFTKMAGEAGMVATAAAHKNGLLALGLISA